MGLLSLGKPLSWDETKQHAEHVRRHGIKQFINLYKKLKNRNDTTLKWGDEVRHHFERLSGHLIVSLIRSSIWSSSLTTRIKRLGLV